MIDGTGEGSQRLKWTKSKGFIDLDFESTKGNLWLLANWQEEQKSKDLEIFKL